jgi:NAD(P)-dependent dehydrogenase (short-subunit alcohol dehydrogenase family)
MEKALLDVSPMRRLAEAAEIGDAVVWLCSDAASFVNGHALPVDGGATIQ